jgi:hypothetical protein
MDLLNAWKHLVPVTNGADEKQIYLLAEEILKTLKKPVNEKNLNLVITKLQEIVKFEGADND